VRFTFVRLVGQALSVGSILLGGVVLFLGYSWLEADNYALVEAAPYGFVAGPVLIGTGLVSLALLARQLGSTRKEEMGDVLDRKL
jgi:hypothetical protein